MERGFGWGAIARLGMVQASIGAIVMLATSLLNRVMVVEYGLAAAIPAGLVAWHYAVQMTRPIWGHGSDSGRRRTPWIVGGMAVLGLGALGAVDATVMFGSRPWLATICSVAAFSMIGVGVGAAGTSVLAMLAASVAPSRRAAAAALTWIMMVAGIVIAAGTAGALLDPFSESRLALVAAGVVAAALLVSTTAVYRLEQAPSTSADAGEAPDKRALADALRGVLADREARRFTIFIFVSMLAYSMQDLILEPFAGLRYGMTPAQSTSLSGIQHGGVLLGMIVAGIGGSAFGGRAPRELRPWIVFGCVISALALAGLATAAVVGPPWPIKANVFILGFSNGLFAVAAIGAMMGLAGAGSERSEGVRMGIWGASQAIAFGLGGLIGAIGVDLLRHIMGDDGAAFRAIFGAEAGLFMVAALLAVRFRAVAPQPRLASA
jgi:BCD family chlorophyll transporter-like MFS transporter